MNIQLTKIKDNYLKLIEEYDLNYNNTLLTPEEYENKIIELLGYFHHNYNDLVAISEDLHNVKFFNHND